MITSLCDYPLHDSFRGWFGRSLYFAMARNPAIVLFVGDLGYGLFDRIRDDFPDRFVNTGAAEQAMMGAAIGASYAGRIPFVYSITTFLLYRPFEWLRNYVEPESVAVRLVGSGYAKDYSHDGLTHHSDDAKSIISLFPSIHTYFPSAKEEVPNVVERMIKVNDAPTFLCLRR